MQAVLLRTGGMADAQHQLVFDFGAVERQLETSWESAHEKARASRTIFAQRRLRPDDVLPEWHKAVAVLGGEDDVRRFVRIAAERLKAPLEAVKVRATWELVAVPVRPVGAAGTVTPPLTE